MNIYSASKRLNAPFLIEKEDRCADLPIGAHGLIGDGMSAALVRVDGAIDWACLPKFDSPSVFGAMLDPDRGGFTAITPAVRPYESLQRYDPDTCVLETLFRIPGQGALRLTDFMPWSDDPRATVHEIHRRVECFEGDVDLEVVFDPRFEYGAVQPTLSRNDHGVMASDPDGRSLVCVLSRDAGWQDRPEGGVRTRMTLRPGNRLWCVLSWNAEQPEPVAAYRPFECLRYTRAFWREWTRKLTYEGPWRDYVVRSALTLKLLLYAPTGAMVAAPTTSLPEWIGGARNWDYRYAWTRDAALGIRAANLIGYKEEAREFFHFMRDVMHKNPSGGPDIMYSIDGGEVPVERELSHLSGYRNTGPVRIGNGARDQHQYDTPGYLLDAALAYERSGGPLTLRSWRLLRRVIERAASQSSMPDHGIWEPRSGVRHNVHSKLMSWVALDRGRQLAPRFGATALIAPWMRHADELRAEILHRGMDATGTRFVSVYDTDEVDSTLLLMPSYGLLSAREPRVEATRNHVVQELGHNGYLYRYRVDDGVGGDEGAFILCGFWLAEALAMAGKVADAEQVFVRHAEASNHVGLLAEEIDPTSGEMLGNFPQGFSHMGLINAAARIDTAMRIRDEHSARAPRLPLDPL